MAPPVEKKKKRSSADDQRLISSAVSKNEQQSLGSFVTSSFGSKMKRHLRKIWVCNDVWMDIFPLLDHAQLGLKLALLSPRFDALVGKHFDGKRDLILRDPIEIRKDNCAEKPMLFAHTDANSVEFPLSDRPMPNNIRFKHLHIHYIDQSVIAFLHANKHIWARGTTVLDLYVWPHSNNVICIWLAFVREIWPIFATNIRCMQLIDGLQLSNLLRLITSPTDFTINSINSGCLCPAELVTDDDLPNATISAGQALSKWLHTPRKDGHPKRLFFELRGSAEWIQKFKEAFLRATTTTTSSAASYIICFALHAPTPTQIVPFELVNGRTQEKLTLENTMDDGWSSRWLMKRCPIGETATVVQWEDENLDELMNNVVFHLF